MTDPNRHEDVVTSLRKAVHDMNNMLVPLGLALEANELLIKRLVALAEQTGSGEIDAVSAVAQACLEDMKKAFDRLKRVPHYLDDVAYKLKASEQ